MHSRIRATSTQGLRRDNRSIVLNLLRRSGHLSRVALAKAANLTEPAISRITRELIDAGLIAESGTNADGKPGRPMVGLCLRQNGLYVLGIDIGATSQSVCLANLAGEIIERRDLNLLTIKNPESALTYAAEQAHEILQSRAIVPHRLAGIGVTVGGVVDQKNRILINAPTLGQGWANVPVAHILEETLTVPARIEGRPRAILHAEHSAGMAQKKNNILLVHIALGIGVALMIDGRIVHGFTNTAGQIGHLKVDDSDNRRIDGQVGCLDTVASGYAVLFQLGMTENRSQSKESRVGKAWLLRQAATMAMANDPEAIRIYRTAGEWLGRSLGQISAILDPEIIVLAGDIAQIPSYMVGVRSSYSPTRDIPLLTSVITLEQAAICVALDAFVFTHDLDFRRIKTDPNVHSET